jgi:RNA polymerase sigma factor (sigma-70 family)
MPESDSIRSPRTAGEFPDTRFSVVCATGSDDTLIRQQAWATLIRSYWKPAYKYIRIKWRSSEDDAQDLTQEFFTRALDAGFFRRFDPARARFRTYLRVCLHGFLANELKAATRKKRGGDYRTLSLDFDSAERELARSAVAPDVDPEEFFRQESIRSLFADAVAELRERMFATGREVHFRIFERYDLASPGEGARPTYQMLAGEFDLPVTQITNFLALVRREFRRIVLDRLREIAGSESEFRLEAMELLGVDPDDVAS